MSSRHPLISDRYTPLSHKKPLGDPRLAGGFFGMPSWVPNVERRRLTAYTILQAYRDNAARHFLPSTDPKVINQHREYGDAQLLVEQGVAAVLGDAQAITVEGAERHNPDESVDDADGTEADPAAADDGTITDGDGTTASPTDVTPEQAALFAAAAARQDYLAEWARTERFWLKMLDAENRCVGLGDTVYVLGWSGKKKRVTCRVMDPGWYFPVLDPDADEDDYPTKVHFAWEYQDIETGAQVIRRLTYELKEVAPWRPAYLAADEPDATFECHMTDAIWTTADATMQVARGTVKRSGLPGASAVQAWNMLDINQARVKTNADGDPIMDLPIGFDFIPVIHIPNTPSELEHFGESLISPVLQLLDDVSATDTDMAAASATTGSPSIALSGVRPTRKDPVTGRVTEPGTSTVYGPGQMYHLGENGKMDVVDTSKSLDALAKEQDVLLDRLSVNARMPKVILGRKDDAAASGIQTALRFAPMISLISKMRSVRKEKYPLLLKFVQRIAIAGEALDDKVVYPAEITFGSFLPADKAAAVGQVRELLTPTPTISRQTAIAILIDAGFPIDDAAAEIARIEAEDFLGAVALADATADQQAVFDYLHRTPSDPSLVEVTPADQVPTIPVRPDLRGGTPANQDPNALQTGAGQGPQPTPTAGNPPTPGA